ncbi:MAG: SDR family oxidoreductase [Acetobacteraceae bacterium]|nr:SDR family oxidoreductase [Acetobacteraceae bacterium]
MTVVVLGANGMLGHKLLAHLSATVPDVVGTIRAAQPSAALRRLAPRARLLGRVHARDHAGLLELLGHLRPTAVVNAIGVIKQRPEAVDAALTLSVNAVLPHRLAKWCAARGVRLIHFSTDCVFSGRAGPYAPEARPDATDIYGQSKALGEVREAGCLTLRCSIIGHGLRDGPSLIDWFLSRRGGEARGYTGALYTGLPTVVMADIVARALSAWRDLDGVWQVASEAISKHDLLALVNQRYGLGVRLSRDDAFHCDRRLDGSAFAARTGWRPPAWPELVAAMHADFAASAQPEQRSAA